MLKLFIKLFLVGLLLCGTGFSADLGRFDVLMNAEFAELARPPMEALASLIRELDRTPAQPLGPFYPIRKPFEIDTDLTEIKGQPSADGLAIYIQGQIMDLKGNVIPNAKIEIWQACASGKYNHPRDDNPAVADPNFQYYAETYADGKGSYAFKTILPGAYPANEDWWRPPHIHFSITVPGFNPLVTQLYFDGDSFPGSKINEYNEKDLYISRLSQEQRAKLIVPFNESVDLGGLKFGIFNIYLQDN